MKGDPLIKVGIIGCGHWGPNHVRIFSQLPNSKTVMCADLSADRLKAVQRLNPDVSITTDYKKILQSKEIDAVCVATPTNTHFAITKEALENGKHVLCEKPLALTPQECQKLKALAEKHKRILMVGHIFVFNHGITMLREYVRAKELGKIFYAHSERTNLGPFRYDVNALWDLAPHDIAIFNFLFDACPISVSARGQKYLGHSLEDVAFATLEYPQKVLVNVHVSWLDPKKVRQITLVGDKKMAVWDDLNNEGPIKIYDKHVERTATFYANYGEFQLLSKEGSITIPHVGIVEPLRNQSQYFIECIEQKRPPSLADAQKGMDVVKTLCAIQESIDQQGKLIRIS